MEKSRNIKSTVSVFIQKDGKWLMLRRAKDKKYLPGIINGPGGKIERGEGILEAARRELMEETGTAAKNLKLKAAGVGGFIDDEDEYHFKVVVGDWEVGNPKTTDGQLLWLTPEEVLAEKDTLAELLHVFKKFVDPDQPVFTYKSLYTHPNNLVEIVVEE